MSKTVHIIGAGFSGMTLAYRLSQKGVPVIVYDKNEDVGGMISTHKLGPTLAESAAPSISRTVRLENFCKELGLEILEPSLKSKNRFIYRRGVRKWPLNFFETLGLILRGAWAKITGQLKPRPQETLAQWGRRNLGQSASHYTLETAMQGVYAGDAKLLSSTLLLGPLFNKNRERFKGTISFKNGMGELFKVLKNKIESQGGQVLLKNQAALENLQGPVVIATSADRAAQILKPSAPETAAILEKIQMIPLVTATANFPLNAKLPEGFGCLIPRSENLKTLGVLINTSIFDRAWKLRCETWIIGGATDPESVVLSDGEIQDLIVNERAQIFGDNSPVMNLRVTRWSKALPHYTVDMEKHLTELSEPRRQLENDRQIYLHGNYLGGIGLSKILEQTDVMTKRILQKLNSGANQ